MYVPSNGGTAGRVISLPEGVSAQEAHEELKRRFFSQSTTRDRSAQEQFEIDRVKSSHIAHLTPKS